jgi:hypothetical protein
MSVVTGRVGRRRGALGRTAASFAVPCDAAGRGGYPPQSSVPLRRLLTYAACALGVPGLLFAPPPGVAVVLPCACEAPRFSTVYGSWVRGVQEPRAGRAVRISMTSVLPSWADQPAPARSNKSSPTGPSVKRCAAPSSMVDDAAGGNSLERRGTGYNAGRRDRPRRAGLRPGPVRRPRPEWLSSWLTVTSSLPLTPNSGQYRPTYLFGYPSPEPFWSSSPPAAIYASTSMPRVTAQNGV